MKKNGVPCQQVVVLSEIEVPCSGQKDEPRTWGWPVSLRWGLEVGAEDTGGVGRVFESAGCCNLFPLPWEVEGAGSVGPR